MEKNQNQKTVPYDYNRVVLEKLHGVADSDYVNASYVDVIIRPEVVKALTLTVIRAFRVCLSRTLTSSHKDPPKTPCSTSGAWCGKRTSAAS